jgi:hypothetical protein
MMITKSNESDGRDFEKNSRVRRLSVMFGSLPRCGDSHDRDLTIDAMNEVWRHEELKMGLWVGKCEGWWLRWSCLISGRWWWWWWWWW